MKSKLKYIRALDVLLKNLTINVQSCPKFNLVIKIDNQLWKGDFVNFEDNSVKNYYIDNDGDLRPSPNRYQDYFFEPHTEFNYSKLDKICTSVQSRNNLMPVLLNTLMNHLNKFTVFDFEQPPILYNAINLNSNIKLPFIILNEEEYEIISLIEIKDECTHY